MQTLELDFEQAKAKHLLFKTNLRSILYGSDDVNVESVISHVYSPFGKWLYEHAIINYAHIEEIKQLQDIHVRIHQSANELILLYKAGNIDEARKGLSDMELIADNLIAVLSVIEMKLKFLKHPSANIANNELLQTNYKELLVLNNSIRDLDARIKKQADELYATKNSVERQLQSNFSQAPVAICILRGNNFTVELANKLYLELVDKKEDFVGRPLFESLPELEGQGIRELLTGVLESGVAFNGHEIEVFINRNNITEQTFFNFIYQPLKDEDGSISAIMVVCNEVTTQVLASKKINESERRLQIVVDSAELGTFELNVKTKAIVLSERYLNIFGYTASDNPTHKELLSKIHPEDLELRNKSMAEGLKTGILNYTIRVVWTNGSIRWIAVKGKVFYDNKANPEVLLGTVMDVTENMVNQEKIIKANRTLEIAMEAATLGSFELDIETGLSNFNDTSKKNYGFDQDAIITLDLVLKKIHPDDRAYVQNKIQDALTNFKNYNAEYRIILDDQSIRWISSSGKGVYDKDGKPLKLVGVNSNITKRKKAEEELTMSFEKFSLLADFMPQFIWTSDAEGNMNYFNQSVYNYSGLSKKQIEKDGWLQIVHPDERELNIEKWIHSVKTGEEFLFEHRFKKHTGEYRWQLSRAIPQKNKDGKVQMWVGTSTDIQDQKTVAQHLENLISERTKELKKANNELESMNQELSSFAYISSHDLQEPLRKIQTFVSRIKDTDSDNLSEKGALYFNRVENAASKMQVLINDLLTYSRTGASDKFFEKTDFKLLLEEIKGEFAEVLNDKKGNLEILELPVTKGIPFQLRQLFVNLISNAIKFAKADTPPVIKVSSIIINGSDIENEYAHNNETYYKITVSDNGIGFDAEYKQKIFDVFQKLHGKHEYEGTGIGLSICKKIAQNHQGFITAESVINEGADFNLYIPVSL